MVRYLSRKNIEAHAIHGDMYQGKRNAVMKRLRDGELAVLVASDLAARGLDVDDITHVVNYDLPDDPEVYIHRIGRTARAGRGGVAWALVTPDQGPLLTQIEKLANVEIPRMDYPDFKPGPLPDHVRAEQQRPEKRLEASQGKSRYAAPAAPKAAAAAVKADPTKFPGGIVPTKLPPKMMGGRVKTSRSMRGGCRTPSRRRSSRSAVNNAFPPSARWLRQPRMNLALPWRPLPWWRASLRATCRRTARSERMPNCC